MNFRYQFSVLVILLTGVYLNAQVDFTADQVSGCMPLKVKFSLDYTTIDTSIATSVQWFFGDGSNVVSFDPPAVTYPKPGKYSVRIVVNGNATNPIIKTNYISVHSPLPATFTAEPTDSALIYRFVPDEDITDGAATFYYRWQYYSKENRIYNITYIVDNLTQDNSIDTFVFPSTGPYGVSLHIRDSYGCADSTFQQVNVVQALDTTQPFVVGNVFAPASQDFFVIDPQNLNVRLKIQIYSRTGILVFKSEAEKIYWDGRTNSGMELGTGVYFYILESTQGDPTGYYNTKGFIHLFR